MRETPTPGPAPGFAQLALSALMAFRLPLAPETLPRRPVAEANSYWSYWHSAMTVKGTSKDTPTLPRELGASHVVSGAVRRAGSALRVTVVRIAIESGFINYPFLNGLRTDPKFQNLINDLKPRWQAVVEW